MATLNIDEKRQGALNKRKREPSNDRHISNEKTNNKRRKHENENEGDLGREQEYLTHESPPGDEERKDTETDTGSEAELPVTPIIPRPSIPPLLSTRSSAPWRQPSFVEGMDRWAKRVGRMRGSFAAPGVSEGLRVGEPSNGLNHVDEGFRDDEGEADGDDLGACGREFSDGQRGTDKGGNGNVVDEPETEARG